MTTTQVPERTGAVTFKGQPITLIGPALAVGNAAPDFALTAGDLSRATLDTVLDGGKRAALLIVVPSLDTGVCSLESQKFNARLGELPQGVTAFVVSMDLPFAMARWAKEQGDIRLQMLSDYRDHEFGRAYGVLIKELGLLARAIFVIGADKRLHYVEVVKEVANEPDYDAALNAAKGVAET